MESNKQFNIYANIGYKIADVKVDGSSVGAVGYYIFTNVIANHTITASFIQIEYTLTITATNGNVVKLPNKSTYHYGDVVILTATPDAWIYFYQLEWWSYRDGKYREPNHSK